MSRIHGEKKIKRSMVRKYADYHSYRSYLEKDFHYLCGYCGQHSKIIRHPFEIDHFVPKVIDINRKNDYNNLVFSCKTCNRNKWDIWPTNDKNMHHNEKEGFIDPASEEYDNHLKRQDDGSIIGLTDVGKYMVKVLKFDIRPIDTMWKVMQLHEKQRFLAEKIKDEEDYTKLKEYYEINEQLKQLLDFLLDGGK